MLTSNVYATTMEMENHTGEVLERVIENDLSVLKKSYNKTDKYHLPTGSEKVKVISQDDTTTFTNQVAVPDLGLEVLTVLNSEEAPKAYDFEAGTVGMRKQYLCHVDYAKYEADWNVSYSQTVVAGCNPV